MISAWDKSIELLARTEISSSDLDRKLRSRGYDRKEIDETIARLYAAGYLSDERYARAYIRKYSASRSSGRILRELQQKGIRPEAPEQLLEEIYQEEDRTEASVLRSLIRSRLRGIADPGEKEINRIYSWLLRRGFAYHTIRDAISDIMSERV